MEEILLEDDELAKLCLEDVQKQRLKDQNQYREYTEWRMAEDDWNWK